MLYLGIDVGASNIVSAVIDESFNILDKGKVKVGKGITSEQFRELICRSAQLAADNAGVRYADCAYCGIGCPGAIDAERGVLIYAANLGLGDIALSQIIGDSLGIPVFVANDANCAALGEVYAGAAVGAKNALVVTLGTGIGGGIVIDRRIYSGVNGLAGEVGHMTLFPGGLHCACGRKGCWEVYASATALKRQTREAMEQNPDSLMWKYSPTLDKVSGITSFAAMREGDVAAKEVVDTYIYYVAEGLINCINVLQPDVVCIGGGVSNEGDFLIERILDHVGKYRFGIENISHPRIVCARLGGEAGLIGAAMLGQR